MRRRVVEALRRAEIISLLSRAESEADLGRVLPEELCEVFDAEIGLVAEVPDDGPARCIGLVGAPQEAAPAILRSPEVRHASASSRAVGERGSDLLRVGGRASLFCCRATAPGRQVVVGAARLYEQRFDEPEVALIESVALSTAQTLERLWAQSEREELIGRLKASLVGTAEALANALEAKDNYTANHAGEVADLAVAVGREMGLGEVDLEDLRYGAIFHDIGKIAIPDAILNKPGPLDPGEREVMMRHPEIGVQIIDPIPYLSEDVKRMVRHDHERFDGSGYPDGLAGEAIPLGARIILVVDGFHAMTSNRPYRRAMPREEALAELARHSGAQFDPDVVAAFVRLVLALAAPAPVGDAVVVALPPALDRSPATRAGTACEGAVDLLRAPALADRGLHDPPAGADDLGRLGLLERADPAPGADACLPQRLDPDHVADPGDESLVEERRADPLRRLPAGEPLARRQPRRSRPRAGRGRAGSAPDRSARGPRWSGGATCSR